VYFEIEGLDDERAPVLLYVGSLDERSGDLPAARSAYEMSVAICRRTANRRVLAWALARLAHVDVAAGRIEDAGRSYAEALDLHLELGDRRGIARALEGVARVAAARDGAEPAGRLLGAARAIRAAGGAPVPTLEQPEVAETEEEVRARLGESDFTRAMAAGAALELDKAVELAHAVLFETVIVG
jgi:tetratricopeptide (TPR) repeat protein